MTQTTRELRVGKRIAGYRLQRGLSQEAVARRAGIDPSYLSRIETGKVNPTIPTALRIAEALQAPLNEILGPSPPERKDKVCPVSSSGRCILDLVDTRAAPEREESPEKYTTRHIHLLRLFRTLLQQGRPEVLRAVEVLIGELIEDEAARRS